MTTIEEKDRELEQLREEVQRLKESNRKLIEGSEQLLARNMMLSEKLDIYYEVRRRVEWQKELVHKHRELMAHADLRDDEELLAIIETRIEGDEIPSAGYDKSLLGKTWWKSKQNRQNTTDIS